MEKLKYYEEEYQRIFNEHWRENAKIIEKDINSFNFNEREKVLLEKTKEIIDMIKKLKLRGE